MMMNDYDDDRDDDDDDDDDDYVGRAAARDGTGRLKMVTRQRLSPRLPPSSGPECIWRSFCEKWEYGDHGSRFVA